MKEKKDIVFCGRITKHMKYELDKLGANVYDIAKFYLDNKDNTEVKNLLEIKQILEENDSIATKIVNNNEKLDKLKANINFNGSNEELYDYIFNKDINNAIEITLDYFKRWNTNNYPIDEFLTQKIDYVSTQASKCGLNLEEFQGKLLDKYYGSIQMTL